MYADPLIVGFATFAVVAVILAFAIPNVPLKHFILFFCILLIIGSTIFIATGQDYVITGTVCDKLGGLHNYLRVDDRVYAMNSINSYSLLQVNDTVTLHVTQLLDDIPHADIISKIPKHRCGNSNC